MNHAFIIYFILYHFVDFHAFDTHLFHRQDYRRIKLRLMIAVAIVADFEKYDNFHCLPCKKKFVCHLLFLDVSLLLQFDNLQVLSLDSRQNQSIFVHFILKVIFLILPDIVQQQWQV